MLSSQLSVYLEWCIFCFSITVKVSPVKIASSTIYIVQPLCNHQLNKRLTKSLYVYGLSEGWGLPQALLQEGIPSSELYCAPSLCYSIHSTTPNIKSHVTFMIQTVAFILLVLFSQYQIHLHLFWSQHWQWSCFPAWTKHK